MSQIASARAYARAALLGNPSDLHGGCVVAFTVPDFRAEAWVEEGGDGGHSRALVEAALATLAERLADPSVVSLGISCRTTIPWEVGLGGSSAMVIATMRAACAHLGAELRPDELATLALRTETERLGVVAGPQDRVVQAYEGLLCMDFTEGSVERLDPALLPPLFVAWLPSGGEHSGRAHQTVHGRLRAGDGEVRAAMAELADLARRGADALRAGDRQALGALMSQNFELRGRLYDLDPRHVRMVELAQEHGAPANYAGSGGAIVGIAPAGGRYEALRDALGREGCSMIQPGVKPAEH